MTHLKSALAATFSALWLLDTAATIAFVTVLGVEAEANPIMRAAFVHLGVGGFAMVKAGVLAFWLCLQQRAHVAIHLGLVAIMVPVVYMGMVVAWH